MTAREPEPGPKLCPLCQHTARPSTPYEQSRTGKPYSCDPCDLFFQGTASEFQRYRVLEATAAAERMATDPTKGERP